MPGDFYSKSNFKKNKNLNQLHLMLLLVVWLPRDCIRKAVLLARFVDKMKFGWVQELQPYAKRSRQLGWEEKDCNRL